MNNHYFISAEELERTASQLKDVLRGYRIKYDKIETVPGPSVSLYKVFLSPGVRCSAPRTLEDDIAESMHKKGVRIVTLADSIGIEIANEKETRVELCDLLESREFHESTALLPIVLGETFGQTPKVIDLANAPNILVAGATKQGKSVCLNAMVASLLYNKRPKELKLVLIDPKGVEFQVYHDLPSSENREISVVTSAVDAMNVLDGLCSEMNRRYDSTEKHPYIVCFIDEYADLTIPLGDREKKALSRRILTDIIMLAQKGLGAGIHLVIATQRPSKDVITGLIKANFPTRIAFRTSSRIDSMTILDVSGAERLLGDGDMLIEQGAEQERVQGGYVSSRKG